jgi:hypothetical protein
MVIEPGSFLLFASAGYSRATIPDVIYSGNVQSRGGVMLRNRTGARVDAVGFSRGIACTETAPASLSQSVLRLDCQDTDVNAIDFVPIVPALPRNSADTSRC